MKYLEQLENLAQKYKSTWGGDDAGELFCTMLEEGLAYGTKTEMVEIVPEQSVNVVADEYGDIYAQLEVTEYVSSAQIGFTVGETYTVIFNGTKYDCVAKLNPNNMPYIGNDKLYNADGSSNEPFGIVGDYGYFSITTTEPQLLTVSVTGAVSTVTPIDEKFIPNITNGDKLPDATFYGKGAVPLEAIYANKYVFVKLNSTPRKEAMGDNFSDAIVDRVKRVFVYGGVEYTALTIVTKPENEPNKAYCGAISNTDYKIYKIEMTFNGSGDNAVLTAFTATPVF